MRSGNRTDSFYDDRSAFRQYQNNSGKLPNGHYTISYFILLGILQFTVLYLYLRLYIPGIYYQIDRILFEVRSLRNRRVRNECEGNETNP